MEQEKVEISIRDFFVEFSKRKFTLYSLIAISILISSLYIYTSKERWMGELNISLLDPIELSVLDNIKEYKYSFLNKEYLTYLTLSDVYNRDSVAEAVKKIKLIKPENYANTKKYNEAVRALSYNLKIKSPKKFRKDNLFFTENDDYFYSIQFEYFDKQSIKKLFEETLNYCNIKVKEFLIYRLEKEKNKRKKTISNQIRMNELEILRLIAIEEKNNTNRIAFLKEQASIARSAEIRLPVDDMLGTGIEKNLKNTYFLIGYQALEEEISNLKKRTDFSLYNSKINELNVSLDSLKNDNESKIFFASINKTIDQILTNDFQSVKYDLSSIKYKKNHVNVHNFYLMNFGLSILIFVIYVMLRILYRKIYNQ